MNDNPVAETERLIDSQKRAHSIMGNNCFGIEEATKHFGIYPSDEEIAVLAEVPFTDEMLEFCKDTHILIATFQMSILDIRNKVGWSFFYTRGYWYDNQSFMNDRGKIEWRLVSKIPVPNSTSKNWDEQKALLYNREQVPSAQVMVYTIIGHFLATGERLFENFVVRTSSSFSNDSRILVGSFDNEGLFIETHWPMFGPELVGLSSEVLHLESTKVYPS